MATKRIKVNNICRVATEALLKNVFGLLGDIESVTLKPSTIRPDSFESLITFKEAQPAVAALHLSGTELGDQVMIVTADVAPGAANGHSPAFMLAAGGSGAAAGGLGSMDPVRAEEISRTVYVGNIASTAPEADLRQFFEVCGPVAYVRMAGDSSQPTRFAFIEFEAYAGAQAALALTGAQFANRPLKVNHSKNAIIKPPKPTAATLGGGDAVIPTPGGVGTSVQDALQKIREAQMRIAQKYAGAAGVSTAYNHHNSIPANGSNPGSDSLNGGVGGKGAGEGVGLGSGGLPPSGISPLAAQSRSRSRSQSFSRRSIHRGSRSQERSSSRHSRYPDRDRERERERDRDRSSRRRSHRRDRSRDRDYVRERDGEYRRSRRHSRSRSPSPSRRSSGGRSSRHRDSGRKRERSPSQSFGRDRSRPSRH
ncbi:hypothetical protein H4R33_006433 [Dimargaris cristalligena]|uniref:RRM domain-containing protein n=1 Tax=Dimargaris cristalligena TaxID=215637 RepID=A0A4V1J4A9_9FUNG|nr:hypothetical protein H4R33_006433 [Dimargaris cristalligena]RKP34919.1 hypothetical protein BJ085DRAFT_34986 [Dimargaris cristalligena]|eukprot:RKP34919.1 hypothetical protein BJ085DRAFT_34986 [Dimargaris cristalligena]